MEVLFNCPHCGFEDVFDVGEDIETLKCTFCENGMMDKVGACSELPDMVRSD